MYAQQTTGGGALPPTGGTPGGGSVGTGSPITSSGWTKQLVSQEGTDKITNWHYDAAGGTVFENITVNWNSPATTIYLAANSTNDPHTVSYESKGTITYKFVWNSLTVPPPSYLWIKETANATAGATYTGTGGASATADDGLGDAETSRDGYPYVIFKESFGTGYKLLTVTNGVAIVKVSLSASSTATGLGANAFASVSYSPEVTNRAVAAWAYGYETTYGKQMLSGAAGLVTYPWGSYSKAVPAVNSPYNIGPTTISQYIDFVLPGLHDVPGDDVHWPEGLGSPAELHVDFGGVASPKVLDDNGLSHYLWTYNKNRNNLSHGVPYEDLLSFLHYEIPDVGTTYTGFLIHQDGSAIDLGDAGTVDMTKLSYTWNDGVTISYNIAVTPHLPLENSHKYGSQQDQPSIQSSDYLPISNWIDQNEMMAHFNKSLEAVDYRAGAKSAQVLTKVAKEFAGKNVELKLLMVFLDAFLGLVTAPDTDSRQRNIPDNHFPFAVGRAQAGDHGWIDQIPSGDINSQAIQHLYDWQVCQHKMYQTDWYVADVWGASGYQGQDGMETVMFQYTFEEHFKYRYHGGGPLPGGEGN